MRTFLLLSSLAVCMLANAQKVDDVIHAELSFAGYANENNVRDAFLNFSDSTAVAFNKGKAYNVRKAYSKIKPSTTKLLWQPAFAGISASGELGFTTGPFEVRESLKDTITAAGAYSTIWYKGTDNQWKFLADLGVAHGRAPMAVNKIKKIPVGKKSLSQGIKDPKDLDNEFISAYKASKDQAYSKYLHKEACLNLPNALLLQGKKQWTEALQTIPTTLEMSPMEAGISKAGDLAYVYGTVKYDGKTENYLRVWKNTTEGWQIIMQTLVW